MIKLLTHPEQVAEAIQAEILAGKWRVTLPGIVALEKEFKVNRNTVQKALKILEGKKLLVSRGQGISRQIVAPTDYAPKTLKVGMLLYEEVDQSKGEWIVDSMHHLEEAGHSVVVVPETLSSMRMNVRRVALELGISQYVGFQYQMKIYTPSTDKEMTDIFRSVHAIRPRAGRSPDS